MLWTKSSFFCLTMTFILNWRLFVPLLITEEIFGNDLLYFLSIVWYSFFASVVIAYSQPKFCRNALWNDNASTFATNEIIGQRLQDIFINTNNVVYIANKQYDDIVVWYDNTSAPTQTITGHSSTLTSVFLATPYNIYADNDSIGRDNKWKFSSNTSSLVMYVNTSCDELFIDSHDVLCCSMNKIHQVISSEL